MWLMTACCFGQQTSSRDVHLPEAPSAVNRSDSDQQLPSERLIAQETQAGAQQTLSKDPDDHVSMATKIEDLPIEWLIGPYIPVQGKLTPLTLQERRNVYFRQTYLTVGSYLARAFAAGIDQARGTPYEWGGGFPGYGRRFASRYGQYVISNTIVAAGNAGLGYEPRYDFCRCKGFWPRTKHAVARNFYTYNETEHEKRPQIPLYVGSFAAGAISTTWLPGQQNAWKNGAYSALQQVGYGSGINFVSEFAIDILQKLKVRKR
jgi:hypothetical protein